MELEGRPVSFKNTREAQEAGISIIFQELNLVPELSIAENIFIGREPMTRFGLVDFKRMNRDAAALLHELELDVDPRTPVCQLRVGAQQVVEIAKAISFNSRVIIMDEPTSAITEHEIEVLFRQIKRLKQNGVGLIYITHKLDELPQIADDITVFRDGKFVGDEGISRSDARRNDPADGRSCRCRTCFPRLRRSPGPRCCGCGRFRSSTRSGRHDFAVRDVSFEVRSGEVLGIFGLMGAGRTELLQTIFGLYPHTSTGEDRDRGQAR